jgi:hypothetical protein
VTDTPHRRRRRVRTEAERVAPSPADLAGMAGERWPGAAATGDAAGERWPGAAPTGYAAGERWPGAAPTGYAAVAGHDPATPDPEPEPALEDREAERGLRGLVGGGSSQVGVTAAMRARDATRPTDAELADAEANLMIIRRGWTPPPPQSR